MPAIQTPSFRTLVYGLVRSRTLVCGVVWLAALCVGTGASVLPALAAEEAPPARNYVLPPAEASASVQADRGAGGLGMMGRLGHDIGPAVGREDSITHFELMPYSIFDNTMLFGDFRMYRTNPGNLGGNAGLGVRQYIPAWNRIFGAAAFYDLDDSRNVVFEQVGLSLELLGETWDLRANYYSPVGQEAQLTNTRVAPNSADFTGNRLTFDLLTDSLVAAEGVDMLFTVPIRGEWFERFNVEASAGWYHFQTREVETESVWGYRLRLDSGFWNELVHTYLEVTNDAQFDTNVVFGASVNYYGDMNPKRRYGTSQFNRMSEWVRRNYTVVTVDETIRTEDILALNPDDNLPFFIVHVSNQPGDPPSGGAGTVENPFFSIAEAQAVLNDPLNGSPRDIIFVHADSVFSEQVVLQDGDVILGEGNGVDHLINVVGVSRPILLPRATTGVERPLIQGISGPAVTLGNEVEFSGFQIQDITGNAIVGNAVTGPSVFQDISISNVTGSGVLLDSVSGTYLFERLTMSDVDGPAFRVIEGTAQIFVRDSTISNTSDHIVSIESTNAGVVNFETSTLTDTGGEGIQIFDSFGNAAFGPTTITNSTGTGISILDSAGTYTFAGPVSIVNPAGVAVDVDNLAATGQVLFTSSLNIAQRNSIGIDLTNIAGLFRSQLGVVSIGPPAAGNVDPANHAINFQTSTGSVVLGDLTIDGSPGAGINIGDRAGVNTNAASAVFAMNGNTTILGTAGSAIQVLNEPSTVQSAGTITIDERLSHGVEVLNFSGVMNLLGLVAIGNNDPAVLATLPTLDSAIDVQNSTGNVSFGAAVITEAGLQVLPAAPPLIEPAVNLVNNIDPLGVLNPSVTFGSLSVESFNTEALFASVNNRLNISGGDIDTIDATAVEILNTNLMNVRFDSVDAEIQAPFGAVDSDFGINLENNVGDFTITGTGDVDGSGGEIINYEVAGFRSINQGVIGIGDDLGEILESGEASLNNMIFSDNGNGIVFDNLTAAELDNVIVETSVPLIGTGFGLFSNNVPFLLIEDSVFDSNFRSQVRHSITRFYDDPVIVDIRRTDFIGFEDNVPVDDVVTIFSAGAGSGVELEMNFLDNVVEIADEDEVGLTVDWNGPVEANILRNIFRGDDSEDQIAVDFLADSSSGAGAVSINNNIVVMQGIDDTAFLFDFDGPALLEMVGNDIDMTGEDATGFDLRFDRAGNSINVSNNVLDFFDDGGTGLRVRNIVSPSAFRIDGNVMNLFNSGVLLSASDETGILFQNIDGVINLFGDVNNQVNVAADIFTIIVDIPPANVVGSILVNGSPAP